MSPRVKFFIGPHIRGEIAHIPLLYPFWGVQKKASKAYVYTAMQEYQFSKDDFELVTRVEDADYVLLAHNYRKLSMWKPTLVEEFVRVARAAGKPMLIDGSGDIELPVPYDDAIVLRVSRYRYSITKRDIVIPFAAEDLLEKHFGGDLELRHKKKKPSVSFTGWAKLPPMMRLKTWIKEAPITAASLFDKKRYAEHKGLFFREKALNALTTHSGVDARIVARASYSGHARTMGRTFEDNRMQFVRNLNDADYALSVRGDANASVRFYEALSLGRIPLFLDTECVLPLEDRLNYRDFCVFVDYRDLPTIGDMLAEFHRRLSDEAFVMMQRKAREAFRDYLRMDAFSRHLADQLRTRV